MPCVVVALCAAASSATVGVLPLELEDFGSSTTDVRSQLTSALREVLTGHATTLSGEQSGYVAIDTPPRASCERSDECIRSVASTTGVDEVVRIAAQRGRATVWATMTVEVFDADARVVLSKHQDIGVLRAAEEIRALLTQTLDLRHYAGTVEVVGEAPGEHILVDGLPLAPGTQTISVGPHTVTCLSGGGVRSFPIAVQFTKATRLDVSAAANEAVPRADHAPAWPTVAAVSVTAVSVATAGVAFGYSQFVSGRLGVLDPRLNGYTSTGERDAALGEPSADAPQLDGGRNINAGDRLLFTAKRTNAAALKDQNGNAMIGVAVLAVVVAAAGVVAAVVLFASEAGE